MSTSRSIHAVGHHLQKEAISAAPAEKEAYARSAFNRYYYSAFLNARSLLVELLDQSKASEMKHASYPGFLKGTIQKKLSHERRNASKIGDARLVSRIDLAKRSAAELARIMEIANKAREAADYEQDEPVRFGGSYRFSIKSVDISDAHDWEEATRRHCNVVRKVWDEIHS